jgi:hypothetical protein
MAWVGGIEGGLWCAMLNLCVLNVVLTLSQVYGRFKLLDSFEGLLERPIIQDELEKKCVCRDTYMSIYYRYIYTCVYIGVFAGVYYPNACTAICDPSHLPS